MSRMKRLLPLREYSVDVSGINAHVTHKRVRNLTITVKRDGNVFVTAPARTTVREVERALTARHEWIARAQHRLSQQPRIQPLQFVSGETHRFRGADVALHVMHHAGPTTVALNGKSLEIRARRGLEPARLRAAVEQWYRQQLSLWLPDIISGWAAKIGVLPLEWRIRRMRTRWGTCNTRERRIWLNLQLAEMSPSSVEYVVVHELVHLLEASHNSRFRALMDQFLPDWRTRRSFLNAEGRARHLREG